MDTRASLRNKKVDNTYTGLLFPLRETDGVKFPYTPTISSLGGSAAYDQYNILQNNYTQYTYKNSKPDDITITAKFTANTTAEAEYLVAVIHFLRSNIKMDYGVKSATPGNAPKILYFDYLGSTLYKNVPVIIRDYTLTFVDDINYVPVAVAGHLYYVPTLTEISIVLGTQYTVKELKEFSLEELRQKHGGKYI